jgi:HD superfamily phosphohydrolase
VCCCCTLRVRYLTNRTIGVSHLASELIHRFQATQPELEIKDRDTHLITVAGLCHDLGHGPFSHVFDAEFIPRVTGGTSGWTHEDASLMMFNHMVDENHLDYSEDERKFVGDLIEGNIPKDNEARYLYQIVANKTNSVDVDKFDYLARDTYNLGLKASYDFTRLMQYSKVIDGDICYYAKEAYNLYEMFHTRYSLHKMIYTHRASKAVEYMITDVLLAADPVLKISESIFDPELYVNMTDCILRQIEYSRDQALAPAQDILKRLRKRDLYGFVDEILIYPSFTSKVTEAEIVNFQDGNSNLQPEDIIIHDMKINYAMKEKDPVSHVKFYQSGRQEPFYLEKEAVSVLIPEVFQERYIRLYVRDRKNREAARIAFKKWAKSMKSKSSTPKKVKKKAVHFDNQLTSPVADPSKLLEYEM